MNSILLTLLSADDKKIQEEKIKNEGYMCVGDIKELIKLNSHYENYTAIDSEMLFLIDLNINYSIFITENEVFKREDLINKFDLNIFNIEPELIFNNLYIEEKDSQFYVYDYDFTEQINDISIYKTNVYIGKERWKNYLIMHGFMKSLSLIKNSQKNINDNKDIDGSIVNYFINK